NSLDIAVQPFYTVSAARFSRSGSQLDASFQVNSINPVRAVEMVAVYVGRTAILDAVRNEANLIVSGAELDLSSPIGLSINLPASLSGRDVYVRVGVKTAGVQELIYSTVEHLQ